ncbi:hypothetical protein BC829DRAFT_242136 [Chytridium lagenaria]|nr:hypothetical protein BC829DRAFT_242136 [Chytridium lagenaria]
MNSVLAELILNFMATKNLFDVVKKSEDEVSKGLNICWNTDTAMALLKGFSSRGDLSGIIRAETICRNQPGFVESREWFSIRLAGYNRALDKERASATLNEMMVAGYQLSPVDIAVVLGLLIQKGDHSEAQKWISKLLSSDLPSAKSLDILVSQCQDPSSLDFIDEVIEKALEKDLSANDVLRKPVWVDVLVCNRLMHAHFRNDDIDRALEIFQTMLKNDIFPNDSSWTGYMTYLSRRRRHEDLLSLWKAKRTGDVSLLSPHVLKDLMKERDSLTLLFPKLSSWPWE